MDRVRYNIKIEEHGEEMSSIRNAQMSPERTAQLISLAAVNEVSRQMDVHIFQQNYFFSFMNV